MEIDAIDSDTADSCLAWALETGLWDGRPVVWEEASQFSLEVGEKVMSLLFSKDPSSSDFEQMAARLAYGSAHPSDRLALAKKIQALSSQGSVIQAKFGKKISKIWKEHKVAIIVTAAVIVTVIVIAVVTTSTAGTASAPAIAAGGAALDSLCNAETRKPAKAPPEIAPPKAPIIRSPELEIPDKPSFAQTLKGAGSSLTHEVFDSIVSLGSDLPKLAEGIKDLTERISPPSSPLPPEYDDWFAPNKHYEEFVAKGHEVIDNLFSTHQASGYTSEAKANNPLNNQVTIGILPPPGTFGKGIDLSKIQQLIKTGKHLSVAAEELGFSAREIARLEKAGQLENTVATTFKNISHNKALAESCAKFKDAVQLLEPYAGKYLPEIQVRELIHRAGIPTFPRPKGIPENFRVKLADKGAGIKYVHPTDEGTYVRVMPGKPHSQNPNQQNPYVNRRINGRSIDKYGNFVPNNSAESHISLEEFTYENL